MARPKSSQPSYCHHKSSDRAYVTLDGKPVYLGKHGTQASRDKYLRVLNEWIQRGRRPAPRGGNDDGGPVGYSVAQLCAAFWSHAQGYYIGREGQVAGELDNFRQVLKPLKRLYGNIAVDLFTPASLKALREYMIQPKTLKILRRKKNEEGKLVKVEVEVERPGWSRTYANRQVSRIRQIFNWGVEEELIDDVVASRLAKVKALKQGRTTAREVPPVGPADAADVATVLPLLSPPVRAMVEIEQICGARPGEIRLMRGCDLDTTSIPWVYTPRFHKTGHHAKSKREIYLGPQCIEIVKKHLKPNPQAHLFDPREAVEWQRENQAKRKDAENPTPARKSTRKTADHYSKAAYVRAVARACKRAGVKFTPNQLRHAAATRYCGEFGVEATQAMLGHKLGSKITEVYVARNVEAAKKIAAQVG